jgi:hypothetical protein
VERMRKLQPWDSTKSLQQLVFDDVDSTHICLMAKGEKVKSKSKSKSKNLLHLVITLIVNLVMKKLI